MMVSPSHLAIPLRTKLNQRKRNHPVSVSVSDPNSKPKKLNLVMKQRRKHQSRIRLKGRKNFSEKLTTASTIHPY